MSKVELAGSKSSTDGKQLSKRKQRAAQFRDAVKKGESFSNKKTKSLSESEYLAMKEEKDAKKQAKLAEREHRQKEEMERKRAREEVKGKKRKAVDDEEAPVEEKKNEGGDVQKRKRQRNEKSEKPQGPRFILFIGNLPYTATQSTLQIHLTASKPDVIRIPTEKNTQKAKGFAFAEFTGQDASKRMNVCLRLHHTEFEGRRINVELTAGGGGKGTTRKQKLKEKNEKLEAERREIQEAKATKERTRIVAANSAGGQSAGAFIHPSRAARVQ
ncbi:uncharacterized protein V1513DRAFT_436074 [Lipomyces chichibuensis]|uniref:uncharacterized protein n=1 Tax=Lipomyces chichibuensis TaxID=1546026 RepID=UPI003343ACD4